ncbi:MAG: RNA-binding S4 domain-containing protein [Pseudomonadota bacterium]
MAEAPDKLRLDKWLWFARFFKTRSLCAARVAAGAVRINGTPVSKPSTTINVGDVLTFAIGDHVRVIEIAALGTRRGPAPEAQTLYIDRSPPRAAPQDRPPAAPRFEGKGRPTKKDRRNSEKARRQHLE